MQKIFIRAKKTFAALIVLSFAVSATNASAQSIINVSGSQKTPFSVLVPTAEMRTPLVEKKDLDSCVQSFLSYFSSDSGGGGKGSCSWDSVAWMVARSLVNMEVESMINMVQDGFFGGSVFLDDPKGYYGSVSDEITQHFLDDFETTNMLSSVRDRVLQEIIDEQYTNYKSRLESGANFPGGDAGYEAFNNDWNSCPTGDGWDCWVALDNEANNPFYAKGIASEELAKRQIEGLKYSSEEVIANQGYRNLKDCANGNKWVDCVAYTPGSTMKDQVNEYLSSSLNELLQADELDETVLAAAGKVYDLITGWLGDRRLIDL